MKIIMHDLFGDDVVIEEVQKDEKPTRCVSTKLTDSEYLAFKEWAEKLKMSKYRFLRYCIMRQIKDLNMW